jgi:hypothetical protein
MYSFNKYLWRVLRVLGVVVSTENVTINKMGGGSENMQFLNILPLPLFSRPFQPNTLPVYLQESISAAPPPGFKKSWLIFE